MILAGITISQLSESGIFEKAFDEIPKVVVGEGIVDTSNNQNMCFLWFTNFKKQVFQLMFC